MGTPDLPLYHPFLLPPSRGVAIVAGPLYFAKQVHSIRRTRRWGHHS